MLAGFAFLLSLLGSRRSVSELTRQILLGLAFVLWGIDVLLPQSSIARLIGAVVIALYVFDLAWMTCANIQDRQAKAGRG